MNQFEQCIDEWATRCRDKDAQITSLQTALDAEREKVAKLKERLEIGYAFNMAGERISVPEDKVPDGIECRDVTIKAQDERIDELQAQLSQLQALVRALKGDANYTYHVADNPDEDDQYTVYVHVNGQGYGAIAEFYSRNEALAYAEIKRVATLPATPTGEAT